ncbi:MAG: tape measure protein [Bryobacteraceae bacterium]
MSDDSVNLDVELDVADLLGPAKQGTAAVDKLQTSIQRLGKTSTKAVDVKSSWWGVREHAQLLEKQMLQTKNPLWMQPKKRGGFASLFGGAGKEIEELSGKFGGAGGELGEFGSRLGGAGDLLGGFATKAGALRLGLVGVGIASMASLGAVVEFAWKVGEIAVEFGHAAAEAGIFAQESRLAMTQLLHGNAGEAAAEFDDVRHSAAMLGLQVESTVDSFKGLLRSQFKPELAKDIIKMGADLQSVGVNAEEVQGVIVAMSQIKSKGRLQGEELMQLQERGISGQLVQESIMSRMGLTSVSQYQKAQQGGNISSDIAIASILDAVKKKTGETELGQAGKQFASSTITGLKAQMAGAWENILIDAGDQMMPGLQRIGALIGAEFAAITSDPQVAGIGKDLLGYFNEFIDWAEANGPKIHEYIGIGLKVVGATIKVVGATIEWFLDHLDWVIATAEVVGIALLGFAAIGAVIVAALVGIGIVIYGIAWAVYDTLKGIVDFFVWAYESIISIDWSEVGSAIVNGIESVIPDWLKSLLGIGGGGMAVDLAGVQSAANDTSSIAGGTVRSGAASLGVPNINNIKGDTSLQLNLTVPAPPGGTEEDGRSYGTGVASGLQTQFMGFMAGAGENAA